MRFRVGLPSCDIYLSRQHRVLIAGHRRPDALVAAIKLTKLPEIEVDVHPRDLTYIHVLLDHHEILSAHGLSVESMLLAPRSLSALTSKSRSEIANLFGNGVDALTEMAPAASIPSNAEQKRLVERLKSHELTG